MTQTLDTPRGRLGAQSRGSANYKSVFDRIDQWVGSEASLGAVVLEGGHFDSTIGADAFAENSLRTAVALGQDLISRHRKGVRVVFSVLENDLGMVCDGPICNISTGKSRARTEGLPPKLEEILRTTRLVKRERVIVESERTCRNRGLKLLRSFQQANGEFTCPRIRSLPDGSVVFNNRAFETASIGKIAGGVWSAQCPLIMAAHYSGLQRIVRTRFPDTERLMVVDFSDIHEQGKVMNGADLFSALACGDYKTSIHNIFWSDSEGTHQFIS